MGFLVCKHCREEIEVEITPWEEQRGTSYFDYRKDRIVSVETGRVWTTYSACPDCSNAIQLRSRRRNGRPPLDEHHPNSAISNGVLGELLAESFMRSAGHDVKRIGGPRRPDLIWNLGEGVTKTIEVKVATKKRCYWKFATPPVCENRKGDDFVIIANLHTGECSLCTMEEHLNQCSECGQRTVTHLFMSQEEYEILR